MSKGLPCLPPSLKSSIGCRACGAVGYTLCPTCAKRIDEQARMEFRCVVCGGETNIYTAQRANLHRSCAPLVEVTFDQAGMVEDLASDNARRQARLFGYGGAK